MNDAQRATRERLYRIKPGWTEPVPHWLEPVLRGAGGELYTLDSDGWPVPLSPVSAVAATEDEKQSLARRIAAAEALEGQPAYLSDPKPQSTVEAPDWRAAYWRLAKNLDLTELADYDDELASEVRALKAQAEPKHGDQSTVSSIEATTLLDLARRLRSGDLGPKAVAQQLELLAASTPASATKESSNG